MNVQKILNVAATTLAIAAWARLIWHGGNAVNLVICIAATAAALAVVLFNTDRPTS